MMKRWLILAVFPAYLFVDWVLPPDVFGLFGDVVAAQTTQSGNPHPVPVGVVGANNAVCDPYNPTICIASGTPTVILSAASNNSQLVGGSAGLASLMEITIQNTAVTLQDVRFYDTAVAPTCSSATGLVANYPIGGGTATAPTIVTPPLGPLGKLFKLGIGVCITGANANNDNTNAATGLNLNLTYKIATPQ
jgi:hypothetical protein